VSLATPAKLRRLQRALYATAKRDPVRRFHVLYDKVWREDILAHAFALSRENGGAPGVDGVTFAQIETYGVARWLGELREEGRTGRDTPQPVRRVMLPKSGGVGQRPLGIPPIRDRVVHTAAKLVIEPIFGAARNGDDQAGESPAAAVARFGCVAVPDAHDGRPSGAQAQVNVLGADRSDSTGGQANPGAVAVANTTASTGSPHVDRVVRTTSEPSLSKIGEGQRCRRRNGQAQLALAPAYGWRHQGNGHRPKAGKVSWPEGSPHKPVGRGGGWLRDWRIGS